MTSPLYHCTAAAVKSIRAPKPVYFRDARPFGISGRISNVREVLSALSPARVAVVDNWNNGIYRKLPIGTIRETNANFLNPLILNTAVFHVLLRNQNLRSQMRLRCSIVVPHSAALHHEMLKAVESRQAKDMVMIGAIMARRTEGRVFQELIGFPSERYATSPAPVDAARTQKMAKRIAHCDRV